VRFWPRNAEPFLSSFQSSITHPGYPAALDKDHPHKWCSTSACGQMVDAPDFGHVVKTEPYRYKGDDFAGLRAPLVSLQL
jgi:hypothetical protein